MKYRHRSGFQTRCHPLRAAAIGLGETLGPIAEKIDLGASEREQAPRSIFSAIDPSVSPRPIAAARRGWQRV